MASTLDQHTLRQQDLQETVVAVVETSELEDAKRDPRVRTFLTEADAYLTELEHQDRNH